MNRRAFLARVAGLAVAPLFAAPTIEEIERLGWRRRLFPGWSPPRTLLSEKFITREALYMLEGHLVFRPEAFVFKYPRIGETVHVRTPQRFVIPSH